MAFLSADAYDRFMGRFSVPLAAQLVEVVDDVDGMVLDVGCGPGALTERLVDRFGASSVAAVDPSEPFLDVVRERCPGVEVRKATAEALPFPDRTFDAVLAQLVVHFMPDPVAGIAEMRRVAKPGGVIAAAVWDDERAPTAVFWRAARERDVGLQDEPPLPGAVQGDLQRIFADAGVEQLRELVITVRSEFDDFDTWWEPYTTGVGRTGDYVAALADGDREALREACARSLPAPPFSVEASAWCVVGRA